MSKMTEQELSRLAKNAQLSLSDDEIAYFMKKLNFILEQLEDLKNEDTTGVEPLEEVLPFFEAREDRVEANDEVDFMVENAFHFEEELFLAPKVLVK